jgi:hypothetical protein
VLIVSLPFCSEAQIIIPPGVTPTVAFDPGENNSNVIHKHYRFEQGSELAPKPSPTPLIDIEGFTKNELPKYLEAAKQFPSFQEVKKYILDNIEKVDPPKCLEDKTETVESISSFPEGLEGENSPYQDILFIHTKDLPPDPEIMFGAATLVVPFIPETPNKSWEYIQTFEVPCLPYRIRLQKSKMYFDFGMPALKNYTKNPKGEYHQYIKEVFLGAKPKKDYSKDAKK